MTGFLNDILFVSDVSLSRVIGGAERVLFEHAIRLSKRGYRVLVLTRMGGEHRHETENIQGVREERYRVNSRNPLFFLASTIWNGQRLFRRLKQRFDFGVINFHQPFSALAVLMAGGPSHVIKVYTCHSLSFEEFITRNPEPSGLLKKLVYRVNVFATKGIERYALKKSDKIIVLSRYMKNKLKTTYQIEEGKIAVVPGGVDTEKFSPARDRSSRRRELNFPEDKLILLTVRNLVPRMGIENLVTAFHEACKSATDLYLIVGGEGPLMGKLKDLVKGLGLQDRVRFEGFIPEELLPDYYACADLFVLPTRTLEGFGLITPEAMACGTPVLGTPVGGIREILEAFDREFLFKDTSPDAMSELILKYRQKIVYDPRFRDNTGTRARSFAVKNFSWDLVIDRLEEVYSQCAGFAGRSH